VIGIEFCQNTTWAPECEPHPVKKGMRTASAIPNSNDP